MTDWLNLSKDLPVEALIWIIIAFLWVVAQLVSQYKEKQRRAQRQTGAPPPSRPQGPSFEDEIRNFLENLSGEREVEPEEDAFAPPPPPRPAEPPAPRPVAVRRRPARRFESDMDTAAQAMARAASRQREILEATAAEMPGEAVVEGVVEQHRGSTHAMIDPETFLVDLRSLRVPMIQIPVQMLSITDEIAPRPPLNTTPDLKRALISQIILSPPLAMGEDKSAYERRPA